MLEDAVNSWDREDGGGAGIEAPAAEGRRVAGPRGQDCLAQVAWRRPKGGLKRERTLHPGLESQVGRRLPHTGSGETEYYLIKG